MQVSEKLPEYTAEVTGVGVLRLLNAIKECGMADSVRCAALQKMFFMYVGTL